MFEDRTTENLKKEALAEISPSLGISTMAGSYADAVVGPLAQAVSRLYKALPAVLSMLFIDPGSGPFIDLVAQDYHSLQRREGTKARCNIVLTGKGGTVIPVGTVFLTAAGLQFSLLEAVAIPLSGSAVGTLEAAQEGAAYNVPPGAIDRMFVNLSGLDSYENTQGAGGTDQESDEALYLRVVDARQRPAVSGNGWDYRRWALEVEGVGEVKIVELRDGPGTVGLTLADSEFQTPTEEIVQAALTHILDNKPIGATPTVRAAQSVEITVRATVITLGTTVEEVRGELEVRLREQFQRMIQTKYKTIYYGPEEDKSYSLLYNRVLALLLSIDGVDTFTSLTVNDSLQDIVIPADSIPVVGEVYVS